MKKYSIMIRLEFIKLRRNPIAFVGIAAGMGAILISLYLAAADKMTEYTFDIFTGNVIHNNMTLFFPFTAVLTLGYMMERERSCSAFKSLFVIPVSFRQLLSAKILAGVCLTTVYSVMQWFLSICACVLLNLPGMTAASVLRIFITMLGMNLCEYAAVLPVIAFAVQYEGGYIFGAVFSVFYGFCTVFATGHGFTAVYPISAGIVLLRLGEEYTGSETLCAVLSLLLTFAFALFMIWNSCDRIAEKTDGNVMKEQPPVLR